MKKLAAVLFLFVLFLFALPGCGAKPGHSLHERHNHEHCHGYWGSHCHDHRHGPGHHP